MGWKYLIERSRLSSLETELEWGSKGPDHRLEGWPLVSPPGDRGMCAVLSSGSGREAAKTVIRISQVLDSLRRECFLVTCICDPKGALCGRQSWGPALLRSLNPPLLTRSSLLVTPRLLFLWKVSDAAGHHDTETLTTGSQVTLESPQLCWRPIPAGQQDLAFLAQKPHPRARLATWGTAQPTGQGVLAGSAGHCRACDSRTHHEKTKDEAPSRSQMGNSLAVQWLGLGAFTAKGNRFNPCLGI